MPERVGRMLDSTSQESKLSCDASHGDGDDVWFADVQQNLDNCIGESGKTKHLMDVSQTLIN